MRTAKQVSVSLVNKPGRLAAVLTALQKEKVALNALAVMDKGSRGVLRFVPDDPQAAAAVLDRQNIRFETHDVLLAELHGNNGGLAKACERLAAEHLNIDYAYVSTAGTKASKSGCFAVIKVNDLAKAQRLLGEPANGSQRVVKRPGRRPTYAR